jgi:hypothetical protein
VPARRPTPGPAEAPPGGARRGFALATAFLCLLAQISGAAHLALVSHVRCFEHDALVHADAGHGPGAQQGWTTAAKGKRAESVPSDVAQHADDHCFVVGLRRREYLAAAPPGPRAADPALNIDAVLWLAHRDVLAAPVPLLRLAPKASPPALLG